MGKHAESPVEGVDYNQEQIDSMLADLIGQLPLNHYSYVVGIANGGTHLSPQVASVLNVPHHEVKISFYDEDGVVEDRGFEWKPNGLLVDDLMDSGKTIRKFKEVFGPIDEAVLFWHDGPRPKYFVERKPDAWIVFPWEKS